MTPTPTTSPSSTPAWFKIAVYAAIAWSLIGVVSFFMDATTTKEALAKLPADQQELFSRRPDWILAVYAVAVFGALAGAVALLLRRKWATPLFAASFAAILFQFVYVLFPLGAIALLGWTAAIFPAVILAAGAAMLQLARAATKRGWLG